MKKLYTLSLVLFACVASFAQTFYSENMGTPTGTTLIADNVFQNSAPIAYSGTADVRATLISSGYAGASAGGNVFITNTLGKYFQIDGLNTSAYASADLVLSFGLNSPNVPAMLVIEASTNGTDWTPLTYTNPGSGWKLVTIGDGAIPSSSTLSLRFSQPDPVAGQFRVDDVKLTSSSASCTLVLGASTTLCDAFTAGTDTYTATIPYTGGGAATYGITTSAGTIGGDNPSTTAEGNITISGVPEGTAITLGITGGTCTLSTEVLAASCAAVNALPFYESFNYSVGSALGLQQKWANVNTGDEILVVADNLDYEGLAATGNSISFGGAGIDTFAELVPSTSGTIYYSYLINVASMAGVTDANGGYISGIGESTTALGATLWTKRVDDNSFNLGIEVRTANAANTTWTSAAYTAGETYMVVVSYTFVDGAGNDEVKLWVNPVIGAAQPVALITDTHSGNDFASVDYFFLRQDSTTETPAAIQIDELRIGTTWASVTGSNMSVGDNKIEGLKMYPNPVVDGTLYINTAANAEKAVVIYDVVGKQVFNTKTSTGSVNVSSLNSGMYFVNITEDGKTATMKLVVR